MVEAQVSVNQFYSNCDSSAFAQEHVEDDQSYISHILNALENHDILDFFELKDTLSWIEQNKFARIGLQFPDHFIRYSTRISSAIEEQSSAKTFILADTSYRSCCVDEVAAAHANCDALVHYGDACLSEPPKILPVRFVLGKLPFDSEKFIEAVGAAESSLKDRSLLLLSDASYGYCLAELVPLLQQRFPSTSLLTASPDSRDDDCVNSCDTMVSMGRRVSCQLVESEDVFVVFIGSPYSPFLPIWLMTYPQCTSILTFDPATSRTQIEQSQSSRQLRKRLFLVEKLKDANTVGLVVGSVGIEGHREAVQRMRRLCKAAGKKIYVISVGKINVPKLSNFTSDIDVFVLLSCPFGVMLDCSDYFRPLLSLFEAEAALNPDSSWLAGPGWTAEFSRFLHDAIGTEEGDCADMSLITGKVRAKVETNEEDGSGGQVALYTAGDYFKERSWRGLDDGIRLEESTEVTDGRSGIAAGYQNEKSSN